MSELPMDFELAIKRFLGDKADHIAELANDEASRRLWLRKVARKLSARVEQLDTYEGHREQLHAFVNKITATLSERQINPWSLVYALLNLCGSLLGFQSLRGAITCSPMFFQTHDQYYTSVMLAGGDTMQRYYDEKNAVQLRREIVSTLKNRGLSDSEIAFVLNTTPLQVRRLRP